MNIVIDFRNTYTSDPALSVFTQNYWQEIARNQPASRFSFLLDKQPQEQRWPANVVMRTVKRSGFNWLDRRILNKMLAKWKADWFVTIHPTGCHLHPAGKKSAAQSNRFISWAANGEGYTQQKAGETVFVNNVVPACGEVVKDLSWSAAETIRITYTGGRSFFLYTGNIDGPQPLTDLLKAFSSFKKWQQSNMQLVLAGYGTRRTVLFEEKLQQYKYRNDVVLIKNPDNNSMGNLVAAAYALLYPSADNQFPLAMLWAAQSGKAIAASDTLISRQISNYAEWVPASDTVEGFAKAMKTLYRDETRMQWLQQQTMAHADLFNRQQMLEAIWQCLQK